MEKPIKKPFWDIKYEISMRFYAKKALALLVLCMSFAFAATLSGTGCSTGGDCVVSSSQTIDHGSSYYFNSLAIEPGIVVTIATSGNAAGGTVRFYVAGDANISGGISADAFPGGGASYRGSNPDGGGYAGGYTSGCSYGYTGGGGGGSGAAATTTADYGAAGGGVIMIAAKAINIPSGGWLSAHGAAGPTYFGGGSGGTIKLYAKKINFAGSVAANGGSVVSGGGGGGAGGSLIFMPFTMTSLSAGAMYFNGGAGGSGGSGAGGDGGAGGCTPAGTGNINRNIKIYNSYVPTVSTFLISSTGRIAGLMDLYNSPYNSKYSGLQVTQKSENLIFGAFSQYFAPYSSLQASFVNASNRSQGFLNLTTGSDGTVATSASMPGTYDVIVDLPAQNGYVYLASSSQQDHSAFAIQSAAAHAVFYPRAVNFALFTPDGVRKAYYPYVLNSSDGIYCAGNTSTAQDSACIVPKNELDNTITRKNYSLEIPANAYSRNPGMGWLQAPSVFYISGDAQQRLRGLATTTVARTGQTIERTVIYAPTQAAEKDFAYTETIPADFAFGPAARVSMALSDGTLLNCTFSAPSTGKLITFSSSNCPILSTQLTNGNWIKFQYDLVTPQPDAFFGESKDYSFSEGSLQLNSFTS